MPLAPTGSRSIKPHEGCKQRPCEPGHRDSRVVYASGEITVDDLVRKVEETGYTATRKDEGKNDRIAVTWAIQAQQWKFVIAAILSLPLLWTMASSSFYFVPVGP